MNYGNLVIYHILITPQNTETKLLNLSQDEQEKKAIYFFQFKRFVEKQFRGFHMKDGNYVPG